MLVISNQTHHPTNHNRTFNICILLLLIKSSNYAIHFSFRKSSGDLLKIAILSAINRINVISSFNQNYGRAADVSPTSKAGQLPYEKKINTQVSHL
jgi:hypothetical protein